MKGGLAELLNFKQKNRDMNEFVKVPVGEKLSYCFGDPALTLMYTMTSTLLIYFYTNVVGISAGAVGMIMLISRVFDGFSDVAMGTIIDRTHSKYGKARIWILRLAFPYAIAAVLLFTMPNIGDIGKIIYAFVTYNLMNTVVYTAISQPFHALGSLMTRDRRDRDTISNIRMMLSITASMIITAFTLPLINYVSGVTGHEQLSWILVTAGYSIVSVFVLLNTYASCTERVQAAPQNKKEDIPFWKSFKITFTNRYFLIALGLMITYTAYQVIIGTDLTYYCQYVLGDANLVMPLSSAEKICTIIGIALLPYAAAQVRQAQSDLLRLPAGYCRPVAVPGQRTQRRSGRGIVYYPRLRYCTVLRRAVFAAGRCNRVRPLETRRARRGPDVFLHVYGSEGRFRLYFRDYGSNPVHGCVLRHESHGGRADRGSHCDHRSILPLRPDRAVGNHVPDCSLL